MTNYYFKIKHKTNYSEKTVCIVSNFIHEAEFELKRCYSNWNRLSLVSSSRNLELATEKQLKYIAFIEKETGIQFTGQTKQEASNYIQENKEEISNYR